MNPKDIFSKTKPWPDPTPDMIESREFMAIWSVIKDWDISVPGAYVGYEGATGNHVRAIIDSLKKEFVFGILTEESKNKKKKRKPK